MRHTINKVGVKLTLSINVVLKSAAMASNPRRKISALNWVNMLIRSKSQRPATRSFETAFIWHRFLDNFIYLFII